MQYDTEFRILVSRKRKLEVMIMDYESADKLRSEKPGPIRLMCR